MNTSLSNLSTPCFFRADGIFCNDGILCYSKPSADALNAYPVMVEDERVTCSVCNGQGRILTAQGEELLAFLGIFARDLIVEIVEERKQR